MRKLGEDDCADRHATGVEVENLKVQVVQAALARGRAKLKRNQNARRRKRIDLGATKLGRRPRVWVLLRVTCQLTHAPIQPNIRR